MKALTRRGPLRQMILIRWMAKRTGCAPTLPACPSEGEQRVRSCYTRLPLVSGGARMDWGCTHEAVLISWVHQDPCLRLGTSWPLSTP